MFILKQEYEEKYVKILNDNIILHINLLLMYLLYIKTKTTNSLQISQRI